VAESDEWFPLIAVIITEVEVEGEEKKEI